MAYVRRTDTLVNEVLNKVREMRRNACRPYLSTGVATDSVEYNEVFNVLEDVVWKKAPDLKDKIPDEWLEQSTHNSVDVRIPSPFEDFTTEVSLKVPDGKKPFKLTPKYISTGYYRSSPTVKFAAEDVPPTMVKWFNERAEREQKIATLTEKYKTIENKLSAFMKGHASLNKMLEAMPEFEHYVPQSFMDRMRQPNKKRASNAVEITIVDELDIDTNELASMAIGHRLATSQSI